MAAALLAVGLCLVAAAPVSAADGPAGSDGLSGSAQQSDTVRVVKSAQSEVDANTDSGSDRRLVDRESSERVDAVVIALWTIAGVMTVLLGLFLWHTSPRRRLRLAGAGAAELSGEAEAGTEVADDESADGGSGGGSARDFAGRVWETVLAWTRLRTGRQQDAEPVDDAPEQENGGESEDESAVWRFDEQDGEKRSV